MRMKLGEIIRFAFVRLCHPLYENHTFIKLKGRSNKRTLVWMVYSPWVRSLLMAVKILSITARIIMMKLILLEVTILLSEKDLLSPSNPR